MGEFAPRWFPGEPRDVVEETFLARLRQQAAIWDVAGLVMSDTDTLTGFSPLVMTLDVPGLPIPRRLLTVSYWTGSSPQHGAALEGAWGDVHLFDAYDSEDPECLAVRGVQASSEDFAVMTAEWLLQQLQRPVVCDEWLHRGQVVATRWRLADTGRVLFRTGRTRQVARRPHRSRQVR